MGDHSAIEWTDSTWNPVTGCSKVSPGCAHCYAETISLRFGRSVGPWTPANAAENVVLHPDRLDQPLRWRRPRMVFVNSMSDLFHDQVPDEYIARVFAVMAGSARHVFQVLTKRPERMRELLRRTEFIEATEGHYEDASAGIFSSPMPWPLPNVWCGTSIENRRFVHRADALRETPAAVRFISAEPLLGPLVSARRVYWASGEAEWPDGYFGQELDLTGIDWLIVGGESGAHHRPIRAEWVRDLRDACLCGFCRADDVRAEHCALCGNRSGRGTAFFFKQWGGRTPKAGGRELDGRTWDEMPRQLQETVPA